MLLSRSPSRTGMPSRTSRIRLEQHPLGEAHRGVRAAQADHVAAQAGG